MTTDSNEPIFQECLQLVGRIYKRVKLYGFEDYSAAPDVFIYAMDGDQLVGTEGLAFTNPSFTERNLKGNGVKQVEALLGKPRDQLRIVESCRSATLDEYKGVFPMNLIGAGEFLRNMSDPPYDYLISSIKPGLCEFLRKKLGYEYLRIAGEWNFSVIPHKYQEWYSEDPQPIAAIHDLAFCFELAKKLMERLPMRLEL
jgi:hypothetical protein